jgi:hypothetical protein
MVSHLHTSGDAVEMTGRFEKGGHSKTASAASAISADRNIARI